MASGVVSARVSSAESGFAVGGGVTVPAAVTREKMVAGLVGVVGEQEEVEAGAVGGGGVGGEGDGFAEEGVAVGFGEGSGGCGGDAGFDEVGLAGLGDCEVDPLIAEDAMNGAPESVGEEVEFGAAEGRAGGFEGGQVAGGDDAVGVGALRVGGDLAEEFDRCVGVVGFGLDLHLAVGEAEAVGGVPGDGLDEGVEEGDGFGGVVGGFEEGGGGVGVGVGVGYSVGIGWWSFPGLRGETWGTQICVHSRTCRRRLEG